MEARLSIFNLTLAILAYIYINKEPVEALFVPTRCSCIKNKETVRKPVIDMKITEKGPHCKNDEIILTLTEGSKVCLNAAGHQGKRLINCWKRIEKDPNRKMECFFWMRPKNSSTENEKDGTS
ncbi:interleukin-8-like [Polypterus senegalus]|uniref:interleukin-8-like n=1 Tax=Polypterus senegalus TaxID=55291 RepID=UPI001966A2EB|nr:interleukin-8-like [Polypterus senegalus]